MKIKLLFLAFLFSCTRSNAVFLPLREADESLIREARQAAAQSYGHLNLTEGLDQAGAADQGVQSYIFRGSTGHANPLSGGRHEHNGGAVSVCHERNRIIVAFHGTKSVDDWVTNFSHHKLEVADLHEGSVHRGFYEFMQTGYERLAELLRVHTHNRPDRYEFVFTGHSLGGAAATLAAAKFFQKFSEVFPDYPRQDNQVKIITFSAPCVGDEIFAGRLGQSFAKNYLRFTSNLDIVPAVPLWGVQTGEEIRILFLEQAGDGVADVQRRFGEPGFSPKAEAVGIVASVGGIIYQIGSGIAQRNIAKVGQGLGGVAFQGILVSHGIPAEQTLCSAFFSYRAHHSELPEGAEYLDESRISSPGQVSWWSSTRNPISRYILSWIGGY